MKLKNSKSNSFVKRFSLIKILFGIYNSLEFDWSSTKCSLSIGFKKAKFDNFATRSLRREKKLKRKNRSRFCAKNLTKLAIGLVAQKLGIYLTLLVRFL